MKKLFGILLTLGLIISLAACQSKPTLSTIDGAVVEVGMSAFTIQTAAGDLSFEKDDSLVVDTSAGDFVENAIVTVSYTGEINGTDTSKATVTGVKVTTPAPAETPEPTSEAIEEHSVTGYIINASMNNISVAADQTELVYDFALNTGDTPTEINTPDNIGLGQGLYVTVTCVGVLDSTDTSNCIVTRVDTVTDDAVAPSGSQNSTPQDQTANSFEGRVIDATMSSITVCSDMNETYVFPLQDTTDVNTANGLGNDIIVNVTYTGTLSDSMDGVSVLSVNEIAQ